MRQPPTLEGVSKIVQAGSRFLPSKIARRARVVVPIVAVSAVAACAKSVVEADTRGEKLKRSAQLTGCAAELGWSLGRMGVPWPLALGGTLAVVASGLGFARWRKNSSENGDHVAHSTGDVPRSR